MTNRKISIAVVFDDHKMFADSFSSLIERMEIFETVISMSHEKELLQFFVKNANQQEIYFFVDYHLHEKHALPLINDARRLNKNTSVIVVSSVLDPVLIQNILSYNPKGFLSKSSGFSETLECINAIRNDNKYVSPFISNILNRAETVPPNPFTARETELLQYFEQGNSIFATAEKTCLSKHTVVAHRRHMMEKAKCRSITELLSFSRKRGLI